MALSVGDRIGKYQVVRILATAPTTEVYAAVETASGRAVALKALRGEYRQQPEHVAYLEHELLVAGQVRHPRIIEIYEFLPEPENPCLVLELCAAPNLKTLLAQGAAGLAYWLPTIVRQAAEALGHMHRQGWIHRDVKPDNFLAGPRGDLKLIDFALAQRKRSALARLFGGRQKEKVQGTRSYMSPEQIRGDAPTAASDLYSLGCMLYELVLGKPPYVGTTPDDLLTRHLKSPVPALAAADANVTREFSDLVRRLMAKQPADRPRSCGAFLDEFLALRIFRKPPPRGPELPGLDLAGESPAPGA